MTLLLRRGAVAFAGSPAGRAGDHPQREKNDSLRKPGPCSRVRPAIGAEPAGCRVRAETGPLDPSPSLEPIQLAGRQRSRALVAARCLV